MTEPAIDTGEILEALNDKVDRDCRNVDTTSGADAVIEWQAPTAANNYTWYRLYKSGWLEQGGIYNYGSSIQTTSVRIDLVKNFSDTNYTINVTPSRGSVENASTSIMFGTHGKSVSSFHTTWLGIAAADNVQFIDWRAQGIAAQS